MQNLLRFALTLCLCFGIFFQSAAQTESETGQIEILSSELAELKAEHDKAATKPPELAQSLANASAVLEAVKTRQNQVKDFMQTAVNAESLLNELKLQKTEASAFDKVDIESSQDALQSQLSVFESERLALMGKLSELNSRQTLLTGRADVIADELVAARERLNDINEIPLTPLTGEENLTQRVSHIAEKTIRLQHSLTVTFLERELQTIPARRPLLKARIDATHYKISDLNNAITSLKKLLSDSRLLEASRLLEKAEYDLSEVDASSSSNVGYVRKTYELAKTLYELQASASANDQRSAHYRREVQKLKQSSETVQSIINTGSLTESVNSLLREIQTTLPKAQTLGKTLSENEATRTRLQLSLVVWQNLITQNREQSEAQSSIVPGFTSDPNVTKKPQNSELVNIRTAILTALLETGRLQVDKLISQEVDIKELTRLSEFLASLLDRKLLWLPTHDRLGADFIGATPSALAWIFDPASWSREFVSLKDSAFRSPLTALIAIAFIVLTFVTRPQLKRRREEIAQRVGHVNTDNYWLTPAAILICVLLALSFPALLFIVGVTIAEPIETSNFNTACSMALVITSIVYFSLNITRIMSQPDGLFTRHFKWPNIARAKLERNMYWLVIVQSVAVFLFIFAMTSDISEIKYSVGVWAFIVSSLSMAVIGYRVFQPQNGIVAELKPDIKFKKYLYILCILFSFLPAFIGVMPILGYFDTAVLLQSNLFATGTRVLGAAIVFGFLYRVYEVSKLRRDRKRALASLQKSADEVSISETPIRTESGELHVINTTPDATERERLDRQVINFLFLITAVYLAVRLWIIWSPLFPALGVADDIILWEGTETINGTKTIMPVSLARVLVSLFLIAGGLIAAKNIRAILDTVLFERLELEQGTRFAIGTITAYICAGFGIVFGLAHLGLDWSKLQWIVAALGVGLGFGLQEIVANFVSGLIILFERPVRVGDLVTIGGLSGTVSNIQVRATTVTDFENRDVLLPNKSIITENVTNWTLRDDVTRLTIMIGVAYGSDIALVQKLIMEIATNHTDVLELPPPNVFFLNHGESSLDFELRVFVDSPIKRLPVTHDMNAGINAVLTEHNIEIPFPQRDLNIRKPISIGTEKPNPEEAPVN